VGGGREEGEDGFPLVEGQAAAELQRPLGQRRESSYLPGFGGLLSLHTEVLARALGPSASIDLQAGGNRGGVCVTYRPRARAGMGCRPPWPRRPCCPGLPGRPALLPLAGRGLCRVGWGRQSVKVRGAAHLLVGERDDGRFFASPPSYHGTTTTPT
jgi:hypothetical protein